MEWIGIVVIYDSMDLKMCDLLKKKSKSSYTDFVEYFYFMELIDYHL